MKRRLVAVILFLACTTVPILAEDNPIKAGQTIDDVSKVMQNAGYKETGLDMLSIKKDTALKMWGMSEGVLILGFSTKDKKVSHISYYFCDERPKAFRKTFEFSVIEFDPKTREMKIKLPSGPAADSAKPAEKEGESEK